MSITNANFLINYGTKMVTLAVPNNNTMSFRDFRNKVKNDLLKVDRDLKVWIQLQCIGGNELPFTEELFNEILKQVHKLGDSNLVTLKVHSFETMVSSTQAFMFQSLTFAKPKATGPIQVCVPNPHAAPAKQPDQPKKITVSIFDDDEDMVECNAGEADEDDEWVDVAEARQAPVAKKVVATSTCTISVGAPVEKPHFGNATVVKKKRSTTAAVVQDKAPTFTLKTSRLPGYVYSEKIKAEVELYEKSGPTGKLDSSNATIQLQVKNTGTVKLNKTFAVYQISGNSDFTKLALPFIGVGKTKVVTLRFNFGSFVTTGTCLFGLGYEEAGSKRYFGPILKADFTKHTGFLRMRFISDNDAANMTKGYTLKNNNDPMTSDEIRRVRDFISNLDYRSKKNVRYTGPLYNQFRQFRDKLKGVDRILGCELIKANIIPFVYLLRYAKTSKVLQGLLCSPPV